MTMYDDSRVVTLLREIEPPAGPPDRLGEVTRRARRSESKRATALAGLMAVVLAAGVISAVNLGERGTTEVLSVAGAAKATQAAGSARVSMRMFVTDGPVNSAFPSGDVMTLNGLIDFVHGRYILKGTNAGQQMETRVIGKDTWTKVPTAIGFGDVGGKPWFHSVDTSQSRTSLLSSSDPAKILEAFAKGRVISSEQVGDRTRTVIRLPADALGQSSGSLKLTVADVTTEIDRDGRVRLVRSQVKEQSIGTLTMEFRYDDFGIEVDVRPPPADQVQESASSGSVTSTVPLTGSGSEADRKKACQQFRSFVKNRPAPKNDQERQQQAQFDEAIAQACD